MNNKNKFSGKTFRLGGYSTLLTVIVIAVAVVINLIVSALPTTYTRLDLSDKKLFTISEQTKDILKNLDEKITIYLIAEKGNEDATITELLDRYKSLSSNISVSYIDPVVQPGFVGNYTADTVNNNSVIVESPKRSKVVGYYDIYEYNFDNYSYTGQYDLSFDGESQITSAIDYVTSDNLPVLYVLTGHGEIDMSETLKSSISKENIETKELNLVTEEAVPEDADCLFIYGPSMDLTEDEATKILRYLENGGNMILTTDYTDASLPNLQNLMANYGVKAVDGIVIEGDSSHRMQGYNHYLVPDIKPHTLTSPLISGNKLVLAPVAHGIEKTDSIRSTVSVSSILSTSDKAYSKLAGYNLTTMEKEAGDIDGPFDIGVAVTEEYEGNETKIVWYGTSSFLDDSIDKIVAGGNTDLFLNSLGWMCQRENTISIRSKNLATTPLVMTTGEGYRWSIITTAVLPVLALIIGAVVYFRRRRK